MGLDMYAHAYKTFPKSADSALFDAVVDEMVRERESSRDWIRKNYPDLTEAQIDKELEGERDLYVSGWAHGPSQLFPAVVALFGREPDEGSPSFTVGIDEEAETMKVACTVAYWRKVNAVHQWFVENVQDGEDECNEHFFEREKWEDLKTQVERALADRDNPDAHLPTQGGFFFGSTEYDEWYWRELQETVEMIDTILKDETLFEGVEFSYQSSW